MARARCSSPRSGCSPTCRCAIPASIARGYERAFRDYLGIRETIWLGEGCVGDDTHGHVDDIARFVAPGVIVLAYEEDPADDENHRRSVDNMRRLELAGAARRRAQGREASLSRAP